MTKRHLCPLHSCCNMQDSRQPPPNSTCIMQRSVHSISLAVITPLHLLDFYCGCLYCNHGAGWPHKHYRTCNNLNPAAKKTVYKIVRWDCDVMGLVLEQLLHLPSCFIVKNEKIKKPSVLHKKCQLRRAANHKPFREYTKLR